ncbi:hypothetical protein BECAL_02753 [Bellilinea caldifistulae]|uniref:DUF4190 domain-containing protein n=1 Tax=Bellilinea caldifistulae TaxID=360411 RepID=A0A0P6X3K5_9CHLR|nr:DUF4190 domain-containing protein [Bellilinea caldifistulae]KPL74399.1 hypothetical protein AC812_11200 [Bellilinea caldifistulae]GAP11564.1 hypothetical protein BECAL_02753 [Bellilinea caldifistulae]
MERTPQIEHVSSHPLAIVGLVLGILGLIGVLPLVGSIGALIAGKMAQKEILEKPELYTGENFARAGIIMGWIGLAIGVVICVLVAVAFLFFMPVGIQTMPQ